MTPQSRTAEKHHEVQIMVGAGPRGETFATAAHRKGAHIKELELCLKVLRTRCRNIRVCCDREECLREVAHSTLGKLGMPVGVTAVEQSQSHGRQVQRVRALREALHIMVGDVKQEGAENIFDHPVPQWAVRHAEWIQKFL